MPFSATNAEKKNAIPFPNIHNPLRCTCNAINSTYEWSYQYLDGVPSVSGSPLWWWPWVDTQSRVYQQEKHILMVSPVYPPSFQLFVTLMFHGDPFNISRSKFFFEPRKILVSSVCCDNELYSVMTLYIRATRPGWVRGI